MEVDKDAHDASSLSSTSNHPRTDLISPSWGEGKSLTPWRPASTYRWHGLGPPLRTESLPGTLAPLTPIDAI